MRKWILPIISALLINTGMIVYAQQSGGPGGFSGGAVTAPITFANGSAAAPSVSFTNRSTSGLYYDNTANSYFNISTNGAAFAQFTSNKMRFPGRVGLQWANSTNDPTATAVADFGIDDDLQYLEFDAQMTLNFPAIRFYTVENSIHSGNYEALEMLGSTGAVTFTSTSGGTGSSNMDIIFSPKGTGAFKVNAPVKPIAGTITANAPGINLTQTWNNAAVAFTGVLENITMTANAANSMLQDWQVGGVSQFRFLASTTNQGQIQVNNANCGTGVPYSFNGNNTTGMGSPSVNQLCFAVNGANIGNTFNNTYNGFGNRSDNVIAWSSSATLPNGVQGANEDTGISRSAAASLVIGNGAQGDASGTLKAATLNAGTVFQINGVNGATHAACSTSVTAITVTGGIITAITCT